MKKLAEKNYHSRGKEKAETSLQHSAFYQNGLQWPTKIWPIEPDRYQFIWLPACPRAQRVAIVYRLLGLEHVIEEVQLAPHRDNEGWRFRDGKHIKELFQNPSQASQPFIFDTKTQQIVTTDQYNLSLYFINDWQVFHTAGVPDLYPADMQEQIDAMNGFIFDHVNVQIYKAGHAPTKEKHDAEASKLFDTLNLLDEHLAKNRYLNGKELTDSDLRLITNLLRADIYYKQFELNEKQITDYPHLLRYTREMFKIPSVSETSLLEEIIETHFHSPHNLEKFGDKFINETVASAFSWLKNE